MRCELVSEMYGGLKIEVIAENENEVVLLERAWRLMLDLDEKPTRGNGQTVTKNGSTGFYLPLTGQQDNTEP